MCLIEIEGLPKLELACSTLVREGMKISTASDRVVEACRGVLEFLLAEHPLDCPICDKAGECQLQNYYEKYGLFPGQFRELKEKREKKIRLGKNLILDRERCILCTRCVRFLNEVTGTQELGISRRGIRSAIDFFEGEPVDNNYSNNLADLCPVGAITDTDFRFKTRTWFLEKKESICPLCSRGCNIFIEHHPGFAREEGTAKVFRISPRPNPEVNRYWICDLGRYGYTYIDKDRWEVPVHFKGDQKTELSWNKVLILLAEKLKTLNFKKQTSRITVVANSGLSNEELFLIQKLFKDNFHTERIYLADPKPGAGDHFLLTAERTPNRRGARELGFDFQEIGLEELARNTEVLLVFGSYLAERFSPADIKAALEKVAMKVLVTFHAAGLESIFDLVLPAALIAEKGGSITNVDGRIQKFSPALPARGESRPEWEFLVSLAKELLADHKFYSRLTSPEFIFKAMGEEIPFFR
jgi:NADH-quinone oxidoreductase subunit G